MPTRIFKYILDTGSKKWPCPKCGKRRAVRFIDSDTGEYLEGDYMRCDRVSECGYHKAPSLAIKAFKVEFLLLQSVSAKAYKLTDVFYGVHFIPKSCVLEINEGHAWVSDWYLNQNNLKADGEARYFNEGNGVINEILKTPNIKEVGPSYHPNGLLDISTPDNLTEFLKREYSPDEVERVCRMYRVTGNNEPWEAGTVFWQIDLEGRIRGGKIMHYRSDGKRTKEPYPRISWMHKVLKLESFNLSQISYGLHLVKKYPDKTIGILESEKSCLIQSLRNPETLWLSVGSISGLKDSMLEPIKGLKIIAYPDKGQFSNWKAKADNLKSLGYQITVSDILEPMENMPEGSDIADIK